MTPAEGTEWQECLVEDAEVGTLSGELMQIGVVAERVGLSLRTIRYYEEVGLVAPTERSPGGFRLYPERDIQRLRLIKQMKPLEFSLEQMRDLLTTVEELAAASDGDAERIGELRDRLSMFQVIVDARIATLREQLHRTEDFAQLLRAPASVDGPLDSRGGSR